jgi:diaminopimelate decarboxylase
MKGIFPIEKFRELQTRFFYYDTKVLRDTLACINKESQRYPNFHVHYAVKANANPKVLTIIRESGMGADFVSGGEVRAAIKSGFPADKVVFAGVGKSDWEINLALIMESSASTWSLFPSWRLLTNWLLPRARWLMWLSVSTPTWAHIRTPTSPPDWLKTSRNSMQDMDHVIDLALELKNVKFIGLHFHIGSQILDMSDFVALCNRINELQEAFVCPPHHCGTHQRGWRTRH